MFVKNARHLNGAFVLIQSEIKALLNPLHQNSRTRAFINVKNRYVLQEKQANEQ